MEEALGPWAIPINNKYCLLQSIVTDTLSAKLRARKRPNLEQAEPGLQVTLLTHNTGLNITGFEGPSGQAARRAWAPGDIVEP